MTICPPPGAPYYNYLGYTSFELPLRTGYVAAYGTSWGTHEAPNGSRHWMMTSAFHSAASDVMIYINNIAFNYSSRVIDGIGSGGAGGCDDKQHHGNARAFDITRIQFSNGTAVDCRGSWEVADVANNRAYAALIASCRIYLGSGSVLSAPIAGGHNNHIHIDTTYTPGVLSTGSGADRVILRRINRVFGGSGIAVSETPAWSLADQNALNHTLSMFGFDSCYNIFGNGWHTIGFLDMVAKHGWGNKPPGYYPPAGC